MSWQGIVTLGLALVVLSVAAMPLFGDGEGFLVVVHPAHAGSEIERSELSNVFLKKKSQRWPDGIAIAPVDQAVGSSVRESFTRSVHRRSLDSVQAYWQRQSFSGRELPPRVVDSDTAMLAFVHKARLAQSAMSRPRPTSRA